MLDAETEVTNSQINLAATVFDEMVASYRIMLVTGQLDPATLRRAGVAQRRDGSLPTLVEWCRQYASLDLRRDDPSRVQSIPDSPTAPRHDELRNDDPFASPADDNAEEEDADPFASPSAAAPRGAGRSSPFEDPDGDAPSVPAVPLPPATSLPGVNNPPGRFEPGDDDEQDPFERRGEQPLPQPVQPQPQRRGQTFDNDERISPRPAGAPVRTAAPPAPVPVAASAPAVAEPPPPARAGNFVFDDDVGLR